jgi:predicted ATP-dependent endonuclease of OLD family
MKCWAEIDNFGNQVPNSKLPSISLDLWFHIDEPNLHRVIDLLPSLAWKGSLVGLRIEFAASDENTLLANFHAARSKARANIQEGRNGTMNYHPSPRSLREHLTDNLQREFELRYYVLDHARFDDSFTEAADYTPLQITSDKGRSGKEILNSLLRVDFLSAQRHLSDNAGGNRAEDLSHCLSRFYERNLEKCEDDYNAIYALTESETMLNNHLARVFEPILRHLSNLGYPGLTNPRLVIKSALNPVTIMSNHGGARVHYALGNSQNGVEAPTLPDRYSGLGFKNLIYMVVELLDIHAQWLDIEENRPPLHLIFIEEPEAYLHVQLQQVFIRKVLDVLSIEGDDALFYRSQLVVTTHSPHILYERGFPPIRYFRRCMTTSSQSSEVLNLSAFYANTEHLIRDFLERYLKLTHCDLFFADAAVLVEGNVERLLLPQMIEKATPGLKAAYLSILEIGGAFGHRFRSLIEFLGITTLIVTDIDSVIGCSTPIAEGTSEEQRGDLDDNEISVARRACMAHLTDAVTSNQTLIQWLPAKTNIADLIRATPEDRTQICPNNVRSLIRVTYQTQVTLTWQNTTATRIGRTLEEAFAFENLDWCQDQQHADLKLRIRGNAKLTLEQLTECLHNKIKGESFNKTDFALALLAQNPEAWKVPDYIKEGLQWLQNEVIPSLAASAPDIIEQDEVPPVPVLSRTIFASDVIEQDEVPPVPVLSRTVSAPDVMR